MKELLFFSIGAMIGGLLLPAVLAWLTRGKPVRCDGGEGQTPLITERDEYE